MALRGKMQAYAEARARGHAPMAAGVHAGYEGAGLKVSVSRIEARQDVQNEIKKLRKEDNDSESTSNESWSMKERYKTPLELLQDVWNNPKAPKSLRYQAAKDALPYCHAKKEGGKKDEVADRSKKAAQGRFGTASRPSHLRPVG